ncbi:MAG: bifunctional 3-(3-hydroxy-phenyl)propionate/3-hydroxycinnamic acid hydroxylase [Pseudomonadota bacterium]|nr:bifunctional 3-(3-hydroxy-phenyl)propionate/3-hydroxycinnamic acid hydroxylase [Pseudomonadota bacterium]
MKINEGFDVALVGYGPVGQLLALKLGQAGYRVAVAERWPALFLQPRAVHYDHEVGRIFQGAGVGAAMDAISMGANEAKIVGAKRQLLATHHMSGSGQSGWRFANGFAQPELENVLSTAVAKWPSVEVMRGWEAVNLAQDATGVDVTLRGGTPKDGQWAANGGVKTLRAKFVVGADGANSFVRRSLGAQFIDLGFKFDWLVVNIKWKPGQERDFGIEQICDPRRPTTVVPGGPGRRRWEFMLVPGDDPVIMSKPETTWKLLTPWDVTPDNAILERHAIYTFRAAWAENWRNGRVLVVGDAAHLMPPFLAQGMCSGLRDVATLSWQLDLVLKGKQPIAFLDNYCSERLAHVQTTILASVEEGKFICIADPDAAAQRDARILAAQSDPTLAPPRPPAPRLGRGILLSGNPHSGVLGFQGMVESRGQRGLFDDVMGGGFSLVGTSIDPSQELSDVNRSFLGDLGAVIAQVTPAGPIRDVDKGYANWFSQQGYGAVLSRPDFYQFAATDDPREINPIVDALRGKLTSV